MNTTERFECLIAIYFKFQNLLCLHVCTLNVIKLKSSLILRVIFGLPLDKSKFLHVNTELTRVSQIKRKISYDSQGFTTELYLSSITEVWSSLCDTAVKQLK